MPRLLPPQQQPARPPFSGDSRGHAPLRTAHTLSSHPLLHLKRLAGLAASLPVEHIEWHSARLDINHDVQDAPSNGLTPLETVLQIATCGSWIALRDIGRARDFAPVVDEIVRKTEPTLRAQGIKMIQPRCDVYISSPQAVTPCHIDHRSSVLMQVRGTKNISIFDRGDRQILSEARLESLAASGRRSAKVPRKYLDRAHAVRLSPGTGLHLPAHAPHYVRNGAEVSVSVSLTYRTSSTDKERAVLCMNRRLRQVGLKPRTLGTSRVKDAVKLAAFRGLGGTRRVWCE